MAARVGHRGRLVHLSEEFPRLVLAWPRYVPRACLARATECRMNFHRRLTMTTLRFAKTGVRRVVRHMIEAKDWEQSWAEREGGEAGKPRPQLIFVKDDGIYLLSNGKPHDLINP